jgi:hypothetical protein
MTHFSVCLKQKQYTKKKRGKNSVKNNPKIIAYLYHKDENPSDAMEYPFNVGSFEDMNESEIRSHISSKWPNLVVREFKHTLEYDNFCKSCGNLLDDNRCCNSCSK